VLFILVSGAPLACRTVYSENGELTRDQCADLIRHVQRLESADTGGLRMARQVGLNSGVEGCLINGTDRAYRCVLQAETANDLPSCMQLMK
jgi:hypothetical protein